MANKEYNLKKRTKEFAHRCVKLALALPLNKLGLHIQGQLIRCSTSTAANYRACCLSQSKKTFVAKISIALEEADESVFWMEFAVDEKLISEQRVKELIVEGKELTSIFIASRKTARKNKLFIAQ